jgi:hypothetical protein
MKQQNLHPQTEVLKTIMPKQVRLGLIGPGETPLGKKALEKPSAISNQQGKKLEKPSAISKLQEEKFSKNKRSTPPTVGKQALEKPSSAISK